MTPSSSQRVAIITGAASGLGLELAHQLSERYRLILIDINHEQLQRSSQSLPGAELFACDLSDPAAIELLLQSIQRQQPDIALLINNAGITHRSLAEITLPAVSEKVMAVDYFAPVRLTQGLLPLLKQSHAKVVNIGSMAGWMPVMARAGYCAAKAALHQYFEVFRAEVRQYGISVLMVYPSFLDTPIEQNALSGNGGKTTHARSTVGKIRSAQWMADNIVRAIHNERERLFPDRFTSLSSIFYRLQPSLFLTLMSRKFAHELEVK